MHSFPLLCPLKNIFAGFWCVEIRIVVNTDKQNEQTATERHGVAKMAMGSQCNSNEIFEYIVILFILQSI